jgi:nucleotide-binding universal stress UspA family protein
MSHAYKRILVALDGSTLAESSLHDAVVVAEAANAELVLLEVVELPRDVLIKGQKLLADEQLELRRQRARRYLDEVRHRLAGHVTKVEVVVAVGPPAEAILSYAQKHDVDLIVMSTHGRSGIQRWLLGSVATKVVERAVMPVLVSPSKSETTSAAPPASFGTP